MNKLTDFKVKQKIVSIIGLGNSLMGDDAVGPYIIEYMRGKYNSLIKPVEEASSLNIKLIDASHDPILAGAIIAEGNPVILIDAAEMNLSPGEHRILKISDIDNKFDLRAVSTHGFNISQVLDMATTFGYSRFVRILAIQLGSIEYGDAISESISNKFSEIIAEILKEIIKLNEKENSDS